MSERCVACLWQRRAHPFSFIDDGACPWQPVVISYVVWKDVSFQCLFLAWYPEQASLEFVMEAHVLDSAWETKIGVLVNAVCQKANLKLFPVTRRLICVARHAVGSLFSLCSKRMCARRVHHAS